MIRIQKILGLVLVAVLAAVSSSQAAISDVVTAIELEIPAMIDDMSTLAVAAVAIFIFMFTLALLIRAFRRIGGRG